MEISDNIKWKLKIGFFLENNIQTPPPSPTINSGQIFFVPKDAQCSETRAKKYPIFPTFSFFEKLQMRATNRNNVAAEQRI